MSDSNSSSEMDEQRHAFMLQMADMAITEAAVGAITFATPLYTKTPYHTSALSGKNWVLELINGHPECIRCELRVHTHVFWAPIAYLKNMGYTHSQIVTLKDHLAIFLYKCVTRLSVWHVGEWFQHSNDTISQCIFLVHHQIRLDC
jgi:hypothetical protein